MQYSRYHLTRSSVARFFPAVHGLHLFPPSSAGFLDEFSPLSLLYDCCLGPARFPPLQIQVTRPSSKKRSQQKREDRRNHAKQLRDVKRQVNMQHKRKGW